MNPSSWCTSTGPALGQPGLVRAGVRDRDQLRPLDRVGRTLQLAGDLEQLVGLHLRRRRGQLGTDGGRLGAQRGDAGSELAGWTYLIILEHTYDIQSCPQPNSAAAQQFSGHECALQGRSEI